MGLLLMTQGKFVEAESYCGEAMDKMRRVRGEDHEDTLLAINNMGYVLQAQGRLADAEPFYQEALEKRRRLVGKDHPDTLVSISNMGALLRDQGEFADAEGMLLPGAALANSRLPVGHPIRRSLTKAIADLYEAWDKAEPGKGYDAKAAEWCAKLRELQGATRPDVQSAATPATGMPAIAVTSQPATLPASSAPTTTQP